MDSNPFVFVAEARTGTHVSQSWQTTAMRIRIPSPFYSEPRVVIRMLHIREGDQQLAGAEWVETIDVPTDEEMYQRGIRQKC
ncbi:MAG: hypothetical protein L0220_05765 [Acidobacteria bacterium]|nr:hypothetical protein [Acidobacteriota bacterium]